MLKELQDYIREHEGFILSEATLKTSDLLKSAYELCLRYGIRAQFMYELEEWFDCEYNHATRKCFELAIDYGHLQEEATLIWHEDVFNFFNDIAPRGYYFGSSEGDGACIGFFSLEGAYC